MLNSVAQCAAPHEPHATKASPFCLISSYVHTTAFQTPLPAASLVPPPAQHSRVQAAVLGLTPAQDVMESLEKRVRSRFSHRKIILTPPLVFEPGKLLAAATGATAPARAAGGPGKKEEEQPITYADTPAGILQDMLCLPTAVTGVCGGLRELPWGVGYAEGHNKAVAAALQVSDVKEGLRRVFRVSLTPATLAGIARAAIAAWDAELGTPAEAGCAGAQAQAVHLGAVHIKAGCDACGAEDLTVSHLDVLGCCRQILQCDSKGVCLGDDPCSTTVDFGCTTMQGEARQSRTTNALSPPQFVPNPASVLPGATGG